MNKKLHEKVQALCMLPSNCKELSKNKANELDDLLTKNPTFDVNTQFQLLNKNTLLIESCVHGNIDTIKVLLKHNVSIDIQNNENTTALINATKGGFDDIVKILLEYDANPNLKDCLHNTAMYYACKFGHYKILHYLLECCDNKNIINEHNNKGYNCLSIVIGNLLKNTNNIKELQKKKNSKKALKLILKYGADARIVCKPMYQHNVKKKLTPKSIFEMIEKESELTRLVYKYSSIRPRVTNIKCVTVTNKNNNNREEKVEEKENKRPVIRIPAKIRRQYARKQFFTQTELETKSKKHLYCYCNKECYIYSEYTFSNKIFECAQKKCRYRVVDCLRCGEIHPVDECMAIRQKCVQCKSRGHFASQCKKFNRIDKLGIYKEMINESIQK